MAASPWSDSRSEVTPNAYNDTHRMCTGTRKPAPNTAFIAVMRARDHAPPARVPTRRVLMREGK